MMRWSTRLFLLSAATSGCSARYYDVGAMEDAGAGGDRGNPGATVLGGASSAGRSTIATGSDTGGTASAEPNKTPGEFGATCIEGGKPPSLTGQFATPLVVWNRLAPLIWGNLEAPPSTLPMVTTPAWADEVVRLAFSRANMQETGAGGASLFVAQWLNLGVGSGEPPQLLGAWENVLKGEVPALQVLLRMPLGGSGRVGVFTEPSWLALHPDISTRGSAMLINVLQLQVPPPPEGLVDAKPDPKLPDREALQLLVSPPACAACHQLFDPIGYALGNFDAAGAYRSEDHGAAIDASGQIILAPGSVEFDGIADFGAQVSERCEPNLALADGFLWAALSIDDYPINQRSALFDANVDRVRQAFIADGRSYPALVRAFAQSPAALRP